MGNITENINPKRNPYTSIFGVLFLLSSIVMTFVKYIVPVFFVLKQEVPFEGWHILIVVLVGLLLIFMNDAYFARIFNRADKFAGKKTDTEWKG